VKGAGLDFFGSSFTDFGFVFWRIDGKNFRSLFVRAGDEKDRMGHEYLRVFGARPLSTYYWKRIIRINCNTILLSPYPTPPILHAPGVRPLVLIDPSCWADSYRLTVVLFHGRMKRPSS
jgi:hypothetical protein